MNGVLFPFFEVMAIRSGKEADWCESCKTLDEANNSVMRMQIEHDSLIQSKRRGYDAIHVVKVISDDTSIMVEEIEL